MKKNNLFRILSIIALIFYTSCGAKEKIIPFQNPQTIAQSQGRDPILTVFSGKIDIDEYDVQRPIDLSDSLVGKVLAGIAGVFADIFVTIGDNGNIAQEPLSLDIPNIGEDSIDNINITSILFKIKSNAHKKAKLDFIERLDIFIANEAMMAEGKKILLASYRYNKARLETCANKCLNLNLKKTARGEYLNLVPALANTDTIYIIPRLEIKKVPKQSFKLEGSLNYKMGINLPF